MNRLGLIFKHLQSSRSFPLTSSRVNNLNEASMSSKVTLYTQGTPNGVPISIFLEELKVRKAGYSFTKRYLSKYFGRLRMVLRTTSKHLKEI